MKVRDAVPTKGKNIPDWCNDSHLFLAKDEDGKSTLLCRMSFIYHGLDCNVIKPMLDWIVEKEFLTDDEIKEYGRSQTTRNI